MSKKEDWPDWLKKAQLDSPDVEVTGGIVVWKGGTWKDGVWKDGIWEGGTWEGGVWKGGVWEDGVWENGTWEGGVWEYGIWKGGTWKGGVWKDGVWENGTWEGGTWEGGVWKGGVCSPNRASYSVLSDGDRVRIGCQKKTFGEWDAIIAGTAEPPEYAPPRGSEAWNLLVASYEACKAYWRTLRKHVDGLDPAYPFKEADDERS